MRRYLSVVFLVISSLFLVMSVSGDAQPPASRSKPDAADSLSDAPDQSGSNVASHHTSPLNAIVTNGDFEIPVASGTMNHYYAGETFGGWTVESGCARDRLRKRPAYRAYLAVWLRSATPCQVK